MLSQLLALWRPIVEILLIWALVYWLLRFFIGTRVIQVLAGLVVLAIIFNIAKFLQLNSVIWVLSKLFAVGVVAFLIIFQPEMRRGLARMGQKTMGRNAAQPPGVVDEIVRAARELSKRSHGALIAFERSMAVRHEIEGGVDLDARVTADLLISIFEPHTPTHDGGVIIAGGRVACCGAFFPLSDNPDLPPSVGTRHRAALGLTEDSDAICLIISEETGLMTIADHGKLSVPLDLEELRQKLQLMLELPANEMRRSFWDQLLRKGGAA